MNQPEPVGPFVYREMDEASAREIVSWQYPAPYDLYTFAPDAIEDNVQWLLTPHYHYYTVSQADGGLIGFRCFGEDAQVTGGDYSADALDLGGGLKPEHTGRGLGVRFMESAFEFARRHFAPVAFRATVAAFNARALRVCARVGYQQVQTFANPHSQRPFVVLMRASILGDA